MKTICLVATVASLLSLGNALGQFDLDIETTVLPNSLTLLTYVDTTVPTVSYQTFINAGSRDETKPGASGIAHVFEHMMFRGTEKHPDYDEAVSYMGPQTNAYTSEDYTCYFVNAKAEFLDQIIEVEYDRVRNLLFTQEAFRRELGPVKEERRRGVDDDAGGYIYQELNRLAYRKHTYRHPVIGWEQDLEKNLKYADAADFRKLFYVPNYTTIVISGNFDRAKTEELVLQYYGDWKPSLPPTSQVRQEPKQDKKRRKDFEWKDSHTPARMLVAYKAPDLNFDSPDLVALQVLSNILFSKTGRLVKRLKTDQSMVEDISGQMDGRKDTGLFLIDASLKPGQEFDSVLAIIESELSEITKNGVTEDELARAVNPMKSRFLFRLSTPARVGGTIGYYQMTGGDYRMMFKYYDMLGSLKVGDIRAAATAYLQPINSTIVTLSPLPSNQGDTAL
ncbi:MAG: insulinase family protein [candidate division Zixibacteria bacterium]|nr:insulinase family protein [candidate division Zixibacteria bacterium]MBU1471076.1 insulinase family protein [candidate division Zixibacteria bacterium]